MFPEVLSWHSRHCYCSAWRCYCGVSSVPGRELPRAPKKMINLILIVLVGRCFTVTNINIFFFTILFFYLFFNITVWETRFNPFYYRTQPRNFKLSIARLCSLPPLLTAPLVPTHPHPDCLLSACLALS